MPSVRPDTVWLNDVEVEEIVVQSESKLPVPSFFLYSQRLSVPLPVTDDVMVSLPLPAPTAAVGVVGLPGLVRNAEALASSVEQPLSLYAL